MGSTHLRLDRLGYSHLGQTCEPIEHDQRRGCVEDQSQRFRMRINGLLGVLDDRDIVR